MAKISLFIGGIRPLPESGRPTGIYKQPVVGPIAIGPEGFIGDNQADRRVHGGPEKAVHLYPARHYAKLAARFPDVAAELVPGSLGENISTPDLDESTIRIGDIYRLGSARLQVCQPRNPCWKIDERFASEGMAAYIAEHQLTGWYWRVVSAGETNPNDELILDEAAADALTLAAAMKVWQAHRPQLVELKKLAATSGIARQWQEKIEKRCIWLQQNQPISSPTAEQQQAQQ